MFELCQGAIFCLSKLQFYLWASDLSFFHLLACSQMSRLSSFRRNRCWQRAKKYRGLALCVFLSLLYTLTTLVKVLYVHKNDCVGEREKRNYTNGNDTWGRRLTSLWMEFSEFFYPCVNLILFVYNNRDVKQEAAHLITGVFTVLCSWTFPKYSINEILTKIHLRIVILFWNKNRR